MKNILKYIEKLRAESFEGWSQDAIDGYLTALGSIEARIKLNLSPVINQVCSCKNIKHCDYEIESNKCFSCGKLVKQTCL